MCLIFICIIPFMIRDYFITNFMLLLLLFLRLVVLIFIYSNFSYFLVLVESESASDNALPIIRRYRFSDMSLVLWESYNREFTVITRRVIIMEKNIHIMENLVYIYHSTGLLCIWQMHEYLLFSWNKCPICVKKNYLKCMVISTIITVWVISYVLHCIFLYSTIPSGACAL